MVISDVKDGKFYQLLPEKENTGWGMKKQILINHFKLRLFMLQFFRCLIFYELETTCG